MHGFHASQRPSDLPLTGEIGFGVGVVADPDVVARAAERDERGGAALEQRLFEQDPLIPRIVSEHDPRWG